MDDPIELECETREAADALFDALKGVPGVEVYMYLAKGLPADLTRRTLVLGAVGAGSAALVAATITEVLVRGGYDWIKIDGKYTLPNGQVIEGAIEARRDKIAPEVASSGQDAPEPAGGGQGEVGGEIVHDGLSSPERD